MWESRVLRRAFERLELHERKLFSAVFRGGGGGARPRPLRPRRGGGQPPRSTRPSQDGSPPRGGPCGPRPAAEREARLIDEDNGRMLPPGFFSRVAKVAGEPLTAYNGRRNTSEEAPHAQTTTFTTTTATGPLSAPHPNSPRLP